MKLAGIQYLKSSKTGKDYRVLHLMEPFSDPASGIGSKVTTEFLNDNIKIDGLKPGMEVAIVYNKGFDGKAYVDSVHAVTTR